MSHSWWCQVAKRWIFSCTNFHIIKATNFRKSQSYSTRWPGLPESTSTQRPTITRWISIHSIVNSLLSGLFLIKFSSLSAPTRIEELTAGSDEKHSAAESRKFTRSSRCGFVAQWLERATRIRKTLGSIPGGAALCFFVWSGCQFFYLCRSWKRRVWLGMIPTRASLQIFILLKRLIFVNRNFSKFETLIFINWAFHRSKQVWKTL